MNLKNPNNYRNYDDFLYVHSKKDIHNTAIILKQLTMYYKFISQ